MINAYNIKSCNVSVDSQVHLKAQIDRGGLFPDGDCHRHVRICVVFTSCLPLHETLGFFPLCVSYCLGEGSCFLLFLFCKSYRG